MIDYEIEIFNELREELIANHTGIKVYDTYPIAKPITPCVIIMQADNYTYRDGIDSSMTEKYSRVMYEVNVITDTANFAKWDGKRIYGTVCDFFHRKGFTRMSTTEMPTGESRAYRVVGRFTAVCGSDTNIYGG